MTWAVPEYSCDLPTPDAILINSPSAGLFILVDRRVPHDDPHLQLLREYQRVRIELHPGRLPTAFTDPPPDGPGGGSALAGMSIPARIRQQVADHVSAASARIVSVMDRYVMSRAC